MGIVGSAAAVVLGSDLNGGSGYKGLALASAAAGRVATSSSSGRDNHAKTGVEMNELPATPTSYCTAVDLMAEVAKPRLMSAFKGKREGGNSSMSGGTVPPPVLTGHYRTSGSRSIDSNDDQPYKNTIPSASLSEALGGCCIADDSASPDGSGSLSMPIRKALSNDRDRPQVRCINSL